MLLILLGLLMVLGISFTNLIFLPFNLMASLHLPAWVGLGITFGVVAWLMDD